MLLYQMLFNFWSGGFVFTQSYDHSTFLVYCFNLDPNPGSFLFDSGIYLTYTKLLTTYRYLTHDLQRIDTIFVASILNHNSIVKELTGAQIRTRDRSTIAWNLLCSSSGKFEQRRRRHRRVCAA